ncbi:MAG: hypothetical protein AAFU41_00735 [Pseudomonadota bacterium]
MASTQLAIDLSEGIEIMPDGSPMIVRYVPNGLHQFRRFGHQCLENKLGGLIIPCLTQGHPVELGFLPDLRAVRSGHAVAIQPGALTASSGAHTFATHGTSSLWGHCSCDDDNISELSQPKPVPLNGSLAFMASLCLAAVYAALTRLKVFDG